MAPEIIVGDPYDKACDWWSIGCILYECIYGHTPFFDNSREKVKKKALQWQRYFRFSNKQRISRPHTQEAMVLPRASEEVKDLLRGLIVDRDRRLTVQELGRHVWFAGFEWHRLLCMQAPWVPQPRKPEDIACYFEPEDQIGEMQDKYKRPRDKILRDPHCASVALDIRKQTAFMGYTFRKSDYVSWGSCAVRSSASNESRARDDEATTQELRRLETVQWIEAANHVAHEMRCPIAPTTLSAF